jgi:hypothetical protein
MIQGKRRNISYKVKTQEYLDSEQWERIENTHEAIISAVTFNEVQRLLCEDTRVGEHDCIYPLAGKVYCAECGGAMVRKMVPCNGKKYFYYVCGNNKQNSTHCSPHSIRAEKLEEAVLTSLQIQVGIVLDMDKAMDGIDHLAWEQREVKKLQSQLEALDAEIQQHQEMRLSVYEDLKNGLIDKSEYENLRRGFSSRIEEAKKAKQELRGEQNTLLCGLNDQQEFLKSFREFANIQVLERNMVVALIDRVEVLDGSNINVDFRYEDRFASIEEFLVLQQKKDKLHVLKRREA